MLNGQEAATIRQYIESIRGRVVKLDETYEKLVQSFNKMKKSTHGSAPSGVVSRIDEIDKAISNSGESVPIITSCTNKMTTIIENMRACLSCKTKGINNDTNLTFGEGYKFYLYSGVKGNRKDSSADEIVFFVPTGEGEDKRMSFVMDQVYGNKNRGTIISHAETLIKKAQVIKQQFPEAPISIIIPNGTLSSCGVSMDAETLKNSIDTLKDSVVIDIQDRNVSVPESGFGDHYVEFGGSARIAGDRPVSGIEIILSAD